MTTETPAAFPEIVADAGPLIHLDEIGCLDLLDDFPTVLVPSQVWEEVLQHRPEALAKPSEPWKRRRIELPQEQEFLALVASFSLDLGEQAGLALMRDYPTAVFLTDDTAARLAAKTLGYRAHGTLGIVLRAIRRGQRTPEQVLEILRTLPSTSTLHLRAELREEIVRAVEHDNFSSF